MTFYAAVDMPSLRLSWREFPCPITIIGAPTYGRVLFLTHDVTISHCHLRGVRLIDCLWTFVTDCYFDE